MKRHDVSKRDPLGSIIAHLASDIHPSRDTLKECAGSIISTV